MWDERYSGDDFAYGRVANDFLRAKAKQMPQGGKVLCLADGEGRNSVWLAEQGFEVTAVDSSQVGLHKGQKLAAERGVKMSSICADLKTFDLGAQQWDGIVSIFCHLPPTLRIALHQRVVMGLKPRGMLILESYHPKQLGFGTGGPPNAQMMMELSGLEVELAGLDFIYAAEIERDVIEGNLHNGHAAVTQLLARKPA